MINFRQTSNGVIGPRLTSAGAIILEHVKPAKKVSKGPQRICRKADEAVSEEDLNTEESVDSIIDITTETRPVDD